MFFSDAILLIRVYAAYPPKCLSRGRMLAVYCPSILLKTGWLINLIIYATKLHQIQRAGGVMSLKNWIEGWELPAAKTILFLGAFDTGYVVSILYNR